MSDLGEYQGRPIVGTGVIIRNTGDGLSQAMATDPQDVTIGDEVFILIEATCVDVHYPAEDPKYPAIGGVRMIPVFRAGTATFMEGAAAAKAIEAQKELNRRYEDERKGQTNISDAILVAAHENGDHAKRKVEGCPECEAETEAENREKAEDDELARKRAEQAAE